MKDWNIRGKKELKAWDQKSFACILRTLHQKKNRLFCLEWLSSRCVYTALFSHQFPEPWEQTFAGNNGSCGFAPASQAQPANQQWHHPVTRRLGLAPRSAQPAQALYRGDGGPRERRIKHQLKQKGKKLNQRNNRLTSKINTYSHSLITESPLAANLLIYITNETLN